MANYIFYVIIARNSCYHYSLFCSVIGPGLCSNQTLKWRLRSCCRLCWRSIYLCLCYPRTCGSNRIDWNRICYRWSKTKNNRICNWIFNSLCFNLFVIKLRSTSSGSRDSDSSTGAQMLLTYLAYPASDETILPLFYPAKKKDINRLHLYDLFPPNRATRAPK